MIFVDRSAVPVPEVLTSSKADRQRKRIVELLSSSNAHLAQLRLDFDPLWTQAKGDLLQLFHGKCAYCETRVDLSGGADIEHFRPKQGALNLDGTKRDHLHYAWLAYEWENLLIACFNCNRRRKEGKQMVGKGEFFPVAKARAPLLAGIADCRATEEALLIEPTFDQPSDHLAILENGACLPLTRIGEVTVELLALNREPLVAARRQKWLMVVEVAATYVRAFRSKISIGRRRQPLLDLLAPDQEYLAAGRAALKSVLDEVKPRGLAAAILAPVLVKTGDRNAAFYEAIPSKSAPVRRKRKPIVIAAPQRYEHREKLPPFARQRIRRIQIRNFKAIEKLDFELRDPADPELTDPIAGALMLLGENASGKSSVLEAVSLALLGTSQIKRLGVPAEDFLRRTDWDAPVSTAPTAEVKIFFEGTKTPVMLTIDPKTKKFLGNEKPATVLLAYGPRRFFSDERGLRRSSEPCARVETLFNPLAVITNPNQWLVNSPDDRFNASVRALRPLLLLKEEALVQRPPKRAKGAEMTFEVQGIAAPLGRLSEGYKTVVAMGVDIMREMLHYWPDLESACGVVLIDELETHLHPRWKMRIVQRLRKAMPQVQFIATTHDPLCLRGLYDGEVQVLSRDESFHIERLANVPNVRGLSVEQLLLSDYFGLFSTEDPSFEDSVSRYVALATKRDRTESEEQELAAHRQKTKEAIVLGETPQAQLVHEAVSQFLLERDTQPAAAREGFKRESLDRIVDLWKSIEPREKAP
jgi:uncharacterized protein (TIGR02646 family)